MEYNEHSINGNTASNVAVHYDKFALFPIFPCLATGRMNTIYNEMLKQGRSDAYEFCC